MRDLHNNLKFTRAISPTSVSNDTAQEGEVIDRQGYESLEFAILAGTISDADATFTALVEHSDTGVFGGEEVAVPDSQLLGTEAEASFQFDDDDTTRKIGYIGDKRYVKVTITPANNTGPASIAVLAIQGHAHLSPVA